LSTVRGHEFAIGSCEILGLDDGLGAAAEQLGPVRAELAGEPIEPVDEVVVELDENFPP
jgi:hypothetical protein